MFDLNEQRLILWKSIIENIQESKLNQAKDNLNKVKKIERFWAFPGLEVLEKIAHYLHQNQKQLAYRLTFNVFNKIQNPREKYFSPYEGYLEQLDSLEYDTSLDRKINKYSEKKPCFELLIFHPNPSQYYNTYHYSLKSLQSDRDEFFYDILFIDNLADAIMALNTNANIQACVSISGCLKQSDLEVSNEYLPSFESFLPTKETGHLNDNALLLKSIADIIRPNIEHYYISETPFNDLPSTYFEKFHRVFYYLSPFKDLHYYVLNGLRERHNTPFFNALYSYSQKPKAVFHALPISQGGSIKDSLWVKDFHQFYGENIFDAETSSTQGGLDSLLNPKGAIKNAQDKASLSFGADRSYFVTNGTSTSNKIVMQANLSPGDIVFVSSDCHKSIPYGVVLSGAHVIFLQTNAVKVYDLYGAVSLKQIKTRMHELKEANLLDKLKQIVLTNSTFDGLLYDVETYMLEILAIKPDIIFHWDEAWYAHAHFHPIYKRRHSMSVARELQARFKTASYLTSYEKSVDKSKLPDPKKVKLRVYATQSTHKTLSSFRQGSMIHIIDEEFNSDIFLDAFYTHTSTSPNYQILASLDIARRQMAIEGHSLMQRSIQLALWLRSKIKQHEKLSEIFQILNEDDIFPENNQKKTATSSTQKMKSLDYLFDYQENGIRADPTRITLDVTKTGLTGGHFRKLLINKYNIQVNKTSRHTVLFIVNIGATEKDILYLFDTLTEISDYLSEEKDITKKSNNNIEYLSMPQTRRYHKKYLPYANYSKHSQIADIRVAYYDAYKSENIEHIEVSSSIIEQAKNGKSWVAANFVTPYPPGFPLLVPGQIIDYDVLIYLSKIISDEIHGLQKDLGLKVFRESFLKEKK